MTNRSSWLLLGAGFTLILVGIGWKAAFAAAFGSLATMIVCFALTDTQRAQRAWVWATLIAWAFTAIVTIQSGPTACGPDDPAGCYIRH